MARKDAADSTTDGAEPRPLRRRGGPNTDAGKAVVSRNNVTHGITSPQVPIPGVEDASAWAAFRQSLWLNSANDGSVFGFLPIGVYYVGAPDTHWINGRVPNWARSEPFRHRGGTAGNVNLVQLGVRVVARSSRVENLFGLGIYDYQEINGGAEMRDFRPNESCYEHCVESIHGFWDASEVFP